VSVNEINIDTTTLLNTNLFCILTIVIPRLPCLFNIANAVSWKVVLVNSDTSDSVSSFNVAICLVASKCYHTELVPCSEGCRRTWWHPIPMMPWLPHSSIPQCKYTRHYGACLEWFQAIGRFEYTFIDAHQLSNMLCNVRSVKSRIKACLFSEDIIISSIKVLIEFQSDMAVWSLTLCYPA